ncbi:hypothetical protein Tco_0835660 [Tanacetum coccineum]
MDWRINAPKDEMPVEGSYFVEDVAVLNTYRTPIQKQPEPLLCLIGLSRYGFVQFDPCSEPHQGEDWYPSPCCSRGATLNCHCEPCNRNGGTGRGNRVFQDTIYHREIADFANENPSQQITGDDRTEDQVQGIVVSEVPPPENVTTIGVAPETDLGEEEIPADASDQDPLSYANPQSIPEQDIAYYSKELPLREFQSRSIPPSLPWSGGQGNIYHPRWGVTNGCLLDTPKACQDLVDHLAPPGYFSELRHLPNDDFLGQYNMNLARQVAMGSQLWLRFEQEAKLLKKYVAQAKNAELVKELESLRAQFTDLQVSNDRLSQQVSTF